MRMTIQRQKRQGAWWTVFPLLFPMATTPLAADNQNSSAVPSLTITLPSRLDVSEYYYVQPVNIELKNADEKNAIVGLNLRVTSNPAGHQQVLSAHFPAPANVTSFSTRVRLAGTGKAVLTVDGELQSGRKISGSGEIRLDEGVDFTDEKSLTRRLSGNVKGLHGPVGTARARLRKKGDVGRISGIIYHPMIPQIGERASNQLESLEIHYRDTMLGSIEFGDAISNDPYVDLRFTDTKPGIGPIQIQWKDDSGNVYEPIEISTK